MCESVVLLKDRRGITTIMTDAVKITPFESGVRCVNMIGEAQTLDGAMVAEMDLLRHRVMLERE
jgi:predicted RNA-binding protein